MKDTVYYMKDTVYYMKDSVYYMKDTVYYMKDTVYCMVPCLDSIRVAQTGKTWMERRLDEVSILRHSPMLYLF